MTSESLTAEPANKQPGWGFPPTTPKAHWFDKDSYRSRCGKVAFIGLREGHWSSNSPDDCADCRASLTENGPHVSRETSVRVSRETVRTSWIR